MDGGQKWTLVESGRGQKWTSVDGGAACGPENPSPLAPRPSPLAPRPSPLAPRPSPLAPRPSPLAPRPSPLAPRPSPLAPRPSPLAPRPSPLAPRPSPFAPNSRRWLFYSMTDGNSADTILWYMMAFIKRIPDGAGAGLSHFRSEPAGLASTACATKEKTSWHCA
jgi:hypothetical protein